MKVFTGLNVFASGVALLMLAAIVGLGAVVVLPADEHRWPLAVASYAVLVPIAFWAWSGRMFSREGSNDPEPQTWRDWTGLFALNLGLSAVFVFIDMGLGHPGISLIFTVAAVSMTMISLPGAVRAWILDVAGRSFSKD